MSGKVATAVRVFLLGYAGAVVWVLAGCGWGVVIGAALEAAFGRGGDGLLDAAGETSLEAVAGALLGSVAAPLVLTSLELITLTPLFALMGKFGGRYPYGNASLGIVHERSARMGAVTAVLIGVVNGTLLGPMCGAGLMLESIHGGRLPCAFVEWSTVLGILAGSIVGLVTMGLTIYRRVPAAWREEVRRGMRQRARPA